VVEIVTPSTAPKYLPAFPFDSSMDAATTIVATIPLKTLTRTGVPNLALITPRDRGPDPS
jgi:hypothetical protein